MKLKTSINQDSGAVAIAVPSAVLLMLLSASAPIWAQANNGSSAPSSAPAASQGSATIENQMIAYEVLRQMAGQIAATVSADAGTSSKACTSANPGEVLLADPSASAEITAYNSFHLLGKSLQDAYAPPDRNAAAQFVAPSLSDIAMLLSAIKNTATYTNQTFQPTPQSMITLLGMALKDADKGFALRTVGSPGDIDTAATEINSRLDAISKARLEANDKTRKMVDPEFAAFWTFLSSASPDGTWLASVIKGYALLSSLEGMEPGDNDTTDYCVLAFSVDAAGGDTRTAHWFLRELFVPTAKPSYNGGAVVSFTLSHRNGNLIDGGMLHYMYDFTKWKNPKVPTTIDFSPPKQN